jgi:death on curing protein
LQNEPLWLAEGHIILANQKIAKRFGFPYLLRDRQALIGALERPKVLWRFGDANVANAASTLLLEIGRKKPFEAGNQQTAFLSCCLFLKSNYYSLAVKESSILTTFIERAIAKILTSEDKSDDLFYRTMRRCICPTHELT